LSKAWGEWLFKMMPKLSVMNQKTYTYQLLGQEFDQHFPGDFPLFWNSQAVRKMREKGLFAI
ncbi:MAG TPA: hypothetical protein VF298_09145, partial [Bacteroidales bacterium]